MRYCNLKFGYNKGSVKSTALENCAGKEKNTLANKTTPKLTGTQNLPGNLYCDKPFLCKVCIFSTNTG